MGLDAFNNNIEHAEMRLIPPDEYLPIQLKMMRKLAGSESISSDNIKEIAEYLGIDEVVEWKTHLRLVT